jgi:cation:H+ antiporter
VLTDVFLLLISLLILITGAEGLVRGASHLAVRLGISSFVVGVTVVAFGTSTPELAAALTSVTTGHPEIAIGNVVGSNIMNIAIVLGLTALVKPIPVARVLIKRETLVLIFVSILPFAALLTEGILNLWLGMIFVALLVVFLIWTWKTGNTKSDPTTAPAQTNAPTLPPGAARAAADFGLIALGIVLIVVGADLLVGSASSLARAFGVSELVIGLTIVAGGTSAPELVTSLVAMYRGKGDLSVGNILGSCVFNILGILGITAIVAPTPLEIPSSMFVIDLPFMVLLAVACVPIFYSKKGLCRISRAEGAILLAAGIAYLVTLFTLANNQTEEEIQPPPITWRSS